MARRAITQRIALEGGDAIRKQLQQLGDAGERAFEDIQRAAEKLRGPGAQFAKSMDAAVKKVRQLGDSMKETGRKIRDFGAGMSVAVTAPVGLLGGAFIKAASDAQESASAFDALFTDQAASVREWGAAVADELGRGNQVILDQASAFQKLFAQVQPNAGAAAELSKEFTVLAQDLASFYNLTEDEALGKLMSGLAGETEPLRDFGVFLNAAAIEAKAMEMGLTGLNNELTDQEKVLASAQLILEKTTAAQGDAARTSESFANQVKRLKGEWADLSVQMGNIILPYALKVVQALASMAQAFQGLSPAVQAAILVIGGLAAIAAPILATIGLMTIGIGGLAAAFATVGGWLAPVVAWFASLGAAGGGLASVFSALGPIIAGIGAVLFSWPALLALLGASFGALAVAIYRNWDEIAAYLGGVFARIRDAWNSNQGEFAEAMKAGFSAVIGAVPKMLSELGTSISTALTEAVQNGLAALDGLAAGIAEKLQGAAQAGVASVGKALAALFAKITEIAAAAWAKLPEGLQSAGEAIKGMFSSIGDVIGEQFRKLDDLASRLVDGIKSKVQSLLRAIGLAKSASGSSGSGNGGSVPGFATGGQVGAGPAPAAIMRRARPANGPIRGPGTGTSDSIVSKVRSGSFILRAKAVRHYGPRLLDALNRLRVPAAEGARRVRAMWGGRKAILARLSNGEFAVRPEAVRHYGVQLFDLLNRLRLPKGAGMPAFSTGGQVIGKTVRRQALKRMALPAFATGGLVSRVEASRNAITETVRRIGATFGASGPSVVAPPSGSRGSALGSGAVRLSLPEQLTAPAFRAAGASTISSVRHAGDRIAHVLNRIGGSVATSATTSGGPVSIIAAAKDRSLRIAEESRALRVSAGAAAGNRLSNVSTIRSHGDRIANAFRSLQSSSSIVTGLPAVAPSISVALAPLAQTYSRPFVPHLAALRLSAPSPMPAFASGGIVSTINAARHYGARISNVWHRLRTGTLGHAPEPVLRAAGGSTAIPPVARGEGAARVKPLPLPGYATGGIASTIRNFGDTMRSQGARLSQVVNHISAPVRSIVSGGSGKGSGGGFSGPLGRLTAPARVSVAAVAPGAPGALSRPLSVSLPGFAGGGSVSTNIARTYRSIVQNHASRLSHVVNQVAAALPSFSGGGSASYSSVRQVGDAIRTIGSRSSQIVNNLRAPMQAFASGGLVSSGPALRQYGSRLSEVMSRVSVPMMMPAFATGGLVATAPTFSAPASGGQSEPYANINLTLGNERFDGLTAPRATAERLERYVRSADVKSAGRRPGWFREI